MEIDKRRICWPNPDATCLEGGCIHCEDYPYRKVTTIIRYCKKVGTLPSRCNAAPKDALKAMNYGLRHMVKGVKDV